MQHAPTVSPDIEVVERSPFAQHMLETWTELETWWRRHDQHMADRCAGFAATWRDGGRVIDWEKAP